MRHTKKKTPINGGNPPKKQAHTSSLEPQRCCQHTHLLRQGHMLKQGRAGSRLGERAGKDRCWAAPPVPQSPSSRAHEAGQGAAPPGAPTPGPPARCGALPAAAPRPHPP